MLSKKKKKRGRKRLVEGHESDFIGFFAPRYMSDALKIMAADERISVSKLIRDSLADLFNFGVINAKKSK